MNNTLQRIYKSTQTAIPKAGKTTWWLLKLIIPLSLFVSFLQYWGIINIIALYLAPAFSIIGLPGESAVVFISSFFLPLYAPIAIIATLPLEIREITILAIMCLVSHNLLVETAIQKKTGSSFTAILIVRLSVSFISAYLLNLLLPAHLGASHALEKAVVYPDVYSMLSNWIVSAGKLSLKIVLIITGLMMLQNILKEFNALTFISKVFAPLMRIMGLSADSSFLWFVAQTLGLTYGSVVLIEEAEHKRITKENANLLNYHIAINHSLLEDTLLFVAIGVPAGWIIVPRFVFAIIVVWSVRGIIRYGRLKREKALIE
jgi:hypothetical protein